jgi:nicotinamidase-related amidase
LQFCIRHTAADAFFRGYKVVIAKDGVGVLTADELEEGTKYLEYVYNAQVQSVQQIIQQIVRL